MKLQSDHFALTGGQGTQGLSDRGAPQRDLGPILRRDRRVRGRVLRIGDQGRDAAAAAQLVEGRVAGDPEQPRPLLAPASIKRAPPAVGPLEGQRGHVLGCRPVAEQSRHVGEDIVAAGAVEHLEAIPPTLGLGPSGKRLGLDHTLTTNRNAIRHALDILTGVRFALLTTVLAVALPAAAPPAAVIAAAASNPTPAQVTKAIRTAERAKTLWATVNICDSRRDPNTLGIRGEMPSLGFPAWLSMRIQVNYYSRSKKKFIPVPGTATVKTIRLGRSRLGLQQGGAVFVFKPHAGLLDASVEFFWRRSGRLLGSTTQPTAGGHHGADFGSPPRFSAAQCRIP
jgi:hypothetical protein